MFDSINCSHFLIDQTMIQTSSMNQGRDVDLALPACGLNPEHAKTKLISIPLIKMI